MHLWGWLKFTFLSAKTLYDVGNGAYLDSRRISGGGDQTSNDLWNTPFHTPYSFILTSYPWRLTKFKVQCYVLAKGLHWRFPFLIITL